VIEAQLGKLRTACEAQGRDYTALRKVLLQGSTAEQPLQSLDAFVDYAGTYQALGIDEIVIHWPVPDSIFANDLTVFEQIATEGLARLG
jgi:diketogulonate reductase-like aldo/keto reductase